METTCEYHNELMQDLGSIKSDIKTILTNQNQINGRYEKHIVESVEFRDKVKMLWAVMHAAKWLIALFLGTGIIWKWIFK